MSLMDGLKWYPSYCLLSMASISSTSVPYASAISAMGSAKYCSSSCCVMPHRASYCPLMLMSLGWLKPLKILTCENLVTPVRSTNFRSSSAALNTE